MSRGGPVTEVFPFFVPLCTPSRFYSEHVCTVRGDADTAARVHCLRRPWLSPLRPALGGWRAGFSRGAPRLPAAEVLPTHGRRSPKQEGAGCAHRLNTHLRVNGRTEASLGNWGLHQAAFQKEPRVWGLRGSQPTLWSVDATATCLLLPGLRAEEGRDSDPPEVQLQLAPREGAAPPYSAVYSANGLGRGAWQMQSSL